MRWRHPKRGQVSPMEFIPVLEDMGLIHAVGQWSLEESCRQMKSWLDQQLPLQQVSVNVSPLQFARHDEFVEVVRQALAAAALPPRHLQLEVTEGMLMGDGARSLATLEALQRIGVELAIDDFGTGYSSLAYLRSFPVSVLKIDRSFVRDMQSSEQSASIVRAVVQMAHSLNLQVTAEGIETTEQGDALRTMGCNTGQGYALGRPMPAADIEAHLRQAVPELSAAG
jgi:EAL domain-containing protein (putative c-di-GMP-specific phosphodiesterase class I)